MAQGINGILMHSIASPELAFLGDCVYELAVKSRLLKGGIRGSESLSRAASVFVSAPAQAQALLKIEDGLTIEEKQVVNRGRNAHLKRVPQNATSAEYRAASALECLFGWLYLAGKQDRIDTLSEYILTEKL